MAKLETPPEQEFECLEYRESFGDTDVKVALASILKLRFHGLNMEEFSHEELQDFVRHYLGRNFHTLNKVFGGKLDHEVKQAGFLTGLLRIFEDKDVFVDPFKKPVRSALLTFNSPTGNERTSLRMDQPRDVIAKNALEIFRKRAGGKKPFGKKLKGYYEELHNLLEHDLSAEKFFRWLIIRNVIQYSARGGGSKMSFGPEDINLSVRDRVGSILGKVLSRVRKKG